MYLNTFQISHQWLCCIQTDIKVKTINFLSLFFPFIMHVFPTIKSIHRWELCPLLQTKHTTIVSNYRIHRIYINTFLSYYYQNWYKFCPTKEPDGVKQTTVSKYLQKIQIGLVSTKTYAIDNVADPFPAFASTTSVPPSWVLFVRALISSSEKLAFGVAYQTKKSELAKPPSTRGKQTRFYMKKYI
jgi:hypothetical protein